jgi:urease accessory protein
MDKIIRTLTDIPTIIRMKRETDMGSITDEGLYRLMAWLSPSYPVGGYAYSHGLEYAVEAGTVSDEKSLITWIEGIVAFGSPRIDGTLFAHAWQAVNDRDDETFRWVAERAAAMRGSAELALESRQQGEAFLKTVRASAHAPELDRFVTLLEGVAHSYPISVAIAAALHGVPVRPALVAYIHAFTANLVSAGVRLVPLGQLAGQRAIEALRPAVLATVDASLRTHPTQIGQAAAVVDWTSVKHETQYTRLFRS